ncbi:glycosyltransferase family 2 protein [Dyadobacter chenwenxiniae]|uniref:Glycosyltransferase family 2 protein n=1 Tax=Dyadobacter chenwenxiniae TaxID=2906456 RepID=A0A9X1PN58_9BACT|nr:glycosyltransferase family A protein [Dyadobacter chenwenxiniae]MCF0064397.1 glycosyltransferase family 2 protein [Dyadobacter chenwenxiniae]UON82397.1 glycosyltransferase family 2 protein [Dyadobacter chenwenxiniae]
MQGISVILPVYNQSEFIGRAIQSMYAQTFRKWEIIIINDGSTDNLEEVIKQLAEDSRIRYIENERNRGLGYCANRGIELSQYEYIAYLPADDIYFKQHLNALYGILHGNEDAVMAYSGVKYHYYDSNLSSQGKTATGKIKDMPIQLVQVLHKKTAERWLEREELVTDDLGRMYWDKLEPYGSVISTSEITAEWVSQPLQRHKIISELKWGGGIHRYKQYYNVKQRLRFQSATGHYIDEFNDYKSIKYKTRGADKSSLKILLVGELAYNPERICALEERGHKLYGLWMERPYNLNTVGPLPFGNVEDIPLRNWQERVKEIKPDIIYALLNFVAVPLAHEVLMTNRDIPFVWHFKEGPFFCRQQGMWQMLMDLFQKSDGQIYINDENKKWFEQFLVCESPIPHVIDGDLPSRFYFKDETSSLLSDSDNGQIHTVIAGRPFGIQPQDVFGLSLQNIHLHIYGDITHNIYDRWIKQAINLAPDHLHLYHNCRPDEWTSEFSKYDAGWLHVFESSNEGELMKMDWMDLNYPARMSTMAAAGLPMIQRDNCQHTVASQNIMRKYDMGVFFSNIDELGEHLRNKPRMKELRDNCWKNRMHFCFDHHVEDLIKFFQKVIQKKNSNNSVLVVQDAVSMNTYSF